MIDKDGFRANVGIILCNRQNLVLWARRAGKQDWQFPQGGINKDETAEAAMYRELKEEIGLMPGHVEILGSTRDWLAYKIPEKYRRTSRSKPLKGQKQIWYLLRLTGNDEDVCLTCMEKPEFDAWRWVDYWQPIERIIDFKREVYKQALTELEPYLTVSPDMLP